MRSLLLLPALLAANPVWAGENESALVYGKNISFSLQAPSGWVMDNQSGIGQGLPVVFYPEGSSWDQGQTVMYANPVDKETPHQTLADFIEADLARFKAESPGLKVRPGRTLTTGDGKTAQVREFQKDRAGNYETVAYIEESKAFVTLALTSRLKRDWMNSNRAFEELIGSYKFVTDQVQ